MKKFLFTTLPSNDLGLLTQSLPIARELRNRGHQIDFCSPAKAPGKVISDAGFNNILPRWPVYSIITGDTSLHNYYRLLCSRHLKRDLGILVSLEKHIKNFGTTEIWNIDHFMYLMGMWNEKFVRAIVDTLVNLISDHKPDIIVDFWNPFMCIAAKSIHKPLISVIQADLHPQSNGFIWWKQPPTELPTPVPVINTILAEYQLQTIKKTGELSLGDLTLIIGMPETDPLPNTTQCNYIGPILWQRQNEKLPDWIGNLRTDQPVIWVYPGNPNYLPGSESPFDSIVIIYACIEALKDMPVQVVLSTGHQPLPKSVLPLPSNFRHTSFVPGLAMAERSDLLIHHGGYGSCQTGLYTGTPAVIIPTYSERESNARRIAALGAGDFILPTANASGRKKKVDVEELRAKIKHVLSDPSYKENAGKISERMRKFGGASEAAKLIENFIQGLDGIETRNK
jgi:UDP:flavonoid glycosyltransferase YjiC (YdhE family)